MSAETLRCYLQLASNNPENNEPYPVLCKRLLIITFRFSCCWRLKAVVEKGLGGTEDIVRSGTRWILADPREFICRQPQSLAQSIPAVPGVSYTV